MNLADLLNKIEGYDKNIYSQAVQRTSELIMPPRAMGELNSIGEKVCAIQGTMKPKVDKRAVFVMAGDHGIVEEGVTAFPQEVTCQMIGAFLAGMATINVLSRQAEAKIIVTDVGTKCDFQDKLVGDNKLYVKKIAKGTANFSKGAAMSRAEAEKSIMVGFEIADKEIKELGLNMIATGEMGIGNTSPASAIGAVFTGLSADIMVGPGAGINSETMKKKAGVIAKGIELNKPDKNDALDVLSKVGGYEIGAIAGVIIAAAYNKIPVVVDGIISTAGAVIAKVLKPETADYMIMGHRSAEPGHIKMVEFLNAGRALVDLGLRLGEGTGAVTAMHLVESSVRIITEIATFAEAGVSVGE